MEVRLGLVASSLQGLAAQLDAVLAGEEAVEGLYRGEVRRHKQELALFMADEDAAQMLEAWLAKRKYGKLLELWAKGLSLDWARLYGECRPRRLRLPAYPFARERCWVPAPQAPAEAATAALHPLVHRNTSNLAEQRYSSAFTGDEFFLADHFVRGDKVLPGVAHLEMARTAVAQALELDAGTGVCLKNVVFSRPIALAQPPLECEVVLRPDGEGQLAYRIQGRAQAGAPATVYSQGAAALIEAEAPRQDLGALRAACTRYRAEPEPCYAFFAAHGLVLGPSFRVLREVHVGEQQVVGRLELPASLAAQAGRFVLHPCMMDAALQASVGLTLAAGETGARLALPFALERLEILGPTTRAMWSWVRRSAGSQPGDRVQKFDVDLCDDEGRVRVRFRGFSTRIYEGGTGAEAAEPVAGEPRTLLWQPQWQPALAPVGEAPAYSERLVLLCDRLADAAALSARLGAACETLPPDYTAQAEALLARLQALLGGKAPAPVLVQVVVPAQGPQQVSAGLAGLLRSARREHSRLAAQLIAVDRMDDVAQLAARLEDNARSPQDVQVRYGEGERQVLAWSELADGPALVPWKERGVYLLTGGLGGLGQVFAREIAQRARGATLVLTGRRALDDAARESLRALETLGATVQYRVLDVADREAVRQLVLQVHEDHAALDGIVHGAGVLRDSLLLNKTPQGLREVLAAKVAGLVHLDEASRDIALDCFLCFSSIAAVTGNAGQADYAAANGFMDAYAAWRNSLVAQGQRHGHTLSLNWPLWCEGGMRVDEATERAMQQATGLVALRTASGIEALYRALGSGQDQVLVMEGEPARLRTLLAGTPAAAAAQAAPGATPAAPVVIADTPTVVAAAPVAATAVPAPAARGEGGSTAERIKALLLGVVAAQAKIRPERIKGDTELNAYGFDSIMLTELGNRLNHEYGLDLTPTAFFEYPTLDALSQYLAAGHAARFAAHLGPVDAAQAAPPTAAPAVAAASVGVARALPMAANRLTALLRPTPPAAAQRPGAAEPIAIIGISGRFPQAGDLDALWEVLREGRDCVGEVPARRWDMSRYYDPQPGRLGKSSSRWGGFIDGVDEFDALFFQISPREALALDPQARLFLQTAWSLLEGSGYTREGLRERHQGRVGVYVGAMAQPTHPADDGDKPIAALSASSAIANRVSHYFNLEGPSFAVDTMCSSALMALHLACRDLQQGECSMAIAGGVCLLLSPQKYVGMSQARLFGSSPASRSFNEGDGYQPAETVGAVLLKPLSRAVADGDPILALVTGTATYHSGRSNGYAAPNPKMQARVMAESLRRAGVGAGDIGWVEAAATGAALGDAVEVAALGSVFAGLRESGRRVPVGAVKSNLGHSEHGSAIAQLAKVLLQMKHGQLAPLLSIGTPNRQLRLDESPLALQRELAAWEAPLGPDGRRLPRRALVNSFAAGGSYLSLVVEEYLPPGAAAVPADTPPGPQLFVFSARDGERLRAVVEQTLHRLEREPGVALRDLAYTLQVGREAMDARLALVADSHAALRERLQAWLAGGEAADAAPASPQPSDEALAAMVARRDLEGLARCWMQGAVLPWAALHAGAPARRIEWATYPFARTVFPIDYEQTPAPAAATQGVPATAQAVDGALDEVVLRAVAGALGVPLAELPLDRPLQALGYTSIAAMELKYRLEAALRCEIGLELIRDAGRTANELARQLADAAPRRTAAAEAASPALPVLVPQPQARHEPFPLTDMQEAFLIGRQSAIDGDQVGAHIYVEIEVHGALDLYRLNRAWNRLVAQHEMLRAVMLDDGRQRVLPEVPEFRCKVIDFRVMDEAERHAKAALLRDAMEHRVFGAGEWPLFDIRVAVHGEGRRRIHFSIDELIVDGLSVDTLIRQWDWMYAHPQQEPAALELSFRDYVLAMKAFEGSQRYRQDLAYWLQRLADLPGGPQFPRPAQAPAAGARRRTRLTHHLPAPQWEALKARAAALGVSSTALVLSVFAELLRGWTDSPSFTLVLTYFNRPPLHPQVRELVGPAISSLLFVVEPRSGEDFEAVVRAQHERLWQALEHSSVSGVQALRQLRARRGRGAPQTLPVVFTSMLGSEVTSEPLQHLGDVAYVVNQTPQVYLDHQLRDGADGLDCSWDVVEDWFAPGFVRALFQAYGRALEGLADGSLAWTVASFAPPQPADPVTAQLAAWAAEAQAEDPLAPFELTDQQQAYAFGRDTRLEGGGSSCQYYQALHVQRLDAARLEQALAALVERHPMLRTVVDAGGSQAVLARVPQVAIERHDLRAHDAPQRRAALEATRHALLGRVTPLGGWPYFAVAVSLLEGEAACVHLCFDLLLADSTSIGQLIVELIALYEQPASLPAPPALSFRAWQRAVERFKGTPAHAERLAYWQRKFAALPPGPALPQRLGAHASHEVRGLTNPVRAEPVEALQQHPGACPSTGSGRTGTGLFGDPFRSEAEEHQRLDGELRHWGALQQQARARGVAPGLVLLAAYLEVLYAWNGCQPLSVVVPGWERLPVHPDIERVVGDFTTLSWVTRGAQVLSFEQRLQAVAREHAQDLAQRPVSGLQALRRVMLRERQRQLRFPVVFTNHITPLQLPGHRFTLGEAMSKTPQVYLDNLSSEAGERLRCSWDFAGGVYAPAMVQAMFEGYLRLLELLGSEPGAWQRSDFNDQIQAPQGACAATPEKLEGVV
jgi:polyketide synthase PksN